MIFSYFLLQIIVDPSLGLLHPPHTFLCLFRFLVHSFPSHVTVRPCFHAGRQSCAPFAPLCRDMLLIVYLHDIGSSRSVFVPGGPHRRHLEWASGSTLIRTGICNPGLVGSGIGRVPFMSIMALTPHLFSHPKPLDRAGFDDSLRRTHQRFGTPRRWPQPYALEPFRFRFVYAVPPHLPTACTTLSPMCATTALQVLPRSLSYAVRPSFPTAYLE